MRKRKLPPGRQPAAKRRTNNSVVQQEIHELIDQRSSLPPIQDNDYQPSFAQIIAPLRDRKRLILENNNETLYNRFIQRGEISNKINNTTQEKFRNSLRRNLRELRNLPKAVERQMGQFLTNQLATLGDETRGADHQRKVKAPFGGLNLITEVRTEDDPIRPGQKKYVEAYNNRYTSDNRIATVNLGLKQHNPLNVMNHEGTHALDDLYMHTQIPGINSLIKLMQSKNYNPMKNRDSRGFIDKEKDWYEQAQAILPPKSFRERYSYDHYGKPNLLKGLKNLSDKKRNQTFNRAQNILKDPEKVKEYNFWHPFAEFTAHSVQNIHKPWNINENNWRNSNDGRKFLSGTLKNIYRNFQELDPNFSSSYPDANQAFLDRIAQVRNYDKHPDADTYIQDYKNPYYNNLQTENYDADIDENDAYNYNTWSTDNAIEQDYDSQSVQPYGQKSPGSLQDPYFRIAYSGRPSSPEY